MHKAALFAMIEKRGEGMKRIAVLTIGQTPRPDITADLQALLPGVRLTEYGALDCLTREQAQTMLGYPGHGELLVTRMGQDREMIRLDGEKLMVRLQACIDRAEQAGAQALLMACTGKFPAYRHTVPLILPGVCQREETGELAAGRQIGVLIPNEDQREQIAGWWALCGLPQVLVAAADPFGPPEQIVRAAWMLKEQGAQVLCLDCFGYTLAHQAAVMEAAGLETVLPRRVIARQAYEQIEV